MLNIDQGVERRAWRTFSVPLPATGKDMCDLYALAEQVWESDHGGTVYDDTFEVVVTGEEGDDHRLVLRYPIDPKDAS